MRTRIVLLLSILAASGVHSQEKRPVERVTLPDSRVTFDLVSIPGGAFRMGAADGAREVTVKLFWIGAHEVTWEEFRRYIERRKEMRVDGITRPSFGVVLEGILPQIRAEQTVGKYPVHSARWHTAMGYCAWLSRKTGHVYRLPTEAEWELACRADGTAIPLKDAAWGKTADGDLHEVGRKRPNGWGLYDMLGNVMEYCLEPFEEGRYAPVLRGGAYSSPDEDLSPTTRRAVNPEWYECDPCRPRSIWWFTDANTTGFRVVRVPGTSLKDLEGYKDKIEITIARSELVKSRPASGFPLARITGEVRNGGDRTLDELELTVYYVTSEGRPHPLDFTFPDHPIYGWCHPVMTSGVSTGERRAPLKPGQSRKFEVEIANCLDAEDTADAKRFGASVSGIRFAKE